jgi:hypothetical protein
MIKNIVWQTEPGKQTDFEREFIEEVLLSRILHRKIFYDGKLSVSGDNAVIIVSHNKRKPDPDLVDYLGRSRNFVLIHLSGENLYDSSALYKNANAVLRSYYDPRIYQANVFTIPLGFKTGFLNTGSTGSFVRGSDFSWFFAGQLKGERAEMLDNFKHLTPHHMHLTSGWDSSDGLSVDQMRAYFSRAIFTLCPFGWINPDSFRIMEALESGSMPVALNFYGFDYFRYVFGDHPFLSGKSWRGLAAAVGELVQDDSHIQRIRHAHVSWYRRYKERLARDVESIIHGQTSELLSKQFAYQREGQGNQRLKLAYHWHYNLPPVVRKAKAMAKEQARIIANQAVLRA